MIHHVRRVPWTAWLAALSFAFATPLTAFAQGGGAGGGMGMGGMGGGMGMGGMGGGMGMGHMGGGIPGGAVHHGGYGGYGGLGLFGFGPFGGFGYGPFGGLGYGGGFGNGYNYGNGFGYGGASPTYYSSGYSSAPATTTTPTTFAPYPTNQTYEPGDGYRYQLYYDVGTARYYYYPVAR